MDDRGQVAVVEPYVIEPAVPVFERVEEASDLVAGGGLADQVAQVALAGDEADHRGGTLGFRGLDELGDLLRLQGDLGGVADIAGQPEDELVEEQHYRVVTEDVLGVLGDDRQALVERDEGLLVRADRPGEPLERADEETADEPAALLAARRLAERFVKRLRVPARGLPLRVVAFCHGSCAMKASSPSRCLLFLRVRDELVVAVDGGQRPAGVLLQHVIDVAAEYGGVERLRIRQMVGHEHEPAVLEPRVVLGDDVREAFLTAGVRVALQDGVQHGHEVRLAGPERAVEVGGPRCARLDGRLDHAEGTVEVLRQQGGHHVVGDR